MLLLLLLLLPFTGALAILVCACKRRSLAVLSSIAPGIGLLLLLSQTSVVFAGQVITLNYPWLATIGLNISLRLDGLSYLFALLVLGIGLLVILYAHYYLSEHERGVKFFASLLLFMGAMLGLVLAGNLLLLVMFWELTSLASFLLIGYWNKQSEARAGARMALAITGGGGFALLAGILLVGHIVGSYELADVLQAGEQLRAHTLYPLALILILIGAFTKSAQFPFHFWLPHAMSAPTPVSAYLHSATMVKAGVFLLARLYPVLSGTDYWFYLVTFTGLATLLVGAVTALFQHDLKGLLAYSTISHLGLITTLFGLGSDLAPVAAIFHIINHATFKASLFMAAGIIDHETGTRDMRRINGLWKYMPHTAVLAMVASLAMAGVPLLNGFLSKEMFFSQTLHQQLLGSLSGVIPGLATIAGIFTVAYSLRFIHDVFFNGEPVNLVKYPPHEPPRYMKIPVEVLVFLCLFVGMLPAYSVSGLLASAAQASLGRALPEYHLGIWHGFNLPLLMSVMALLGGIGLYALREPLYRWYNGLPDLNGRIIFGQVIQKGHLLFARVMARIQALSLQRFIAIMLLTLIAVVVWMLLPLTSVTGSVALSPVDPLTLLGLVAMAVAAILTVLNHRKRLLALLFLSVAGLIISMLFIRFSAPDLALTQLVVEVVTIILMLLVLHFLPARTPVESSSLRRTFDFLIALGCGGLFSVLTYAVLTRPYDSIAQYYLANSVSGGGGANVVNVILVDFRGFDTLGEISVLAIAAIAVLVLLQDLHLSNPPLNPVGQPWAASNDYLPLRILARLLLPLALLMAIFIFLRGHNEPGGGFIAGLITAVGLLLLQVSSGQAWVAQRLNLNYRLMTAMGVILAGATGLASLLFGVPFLTSAHGTWLIPWLGKLELASAMLFDFGVYLTVVGSTLLILAGLGSQGQAAIKLLEEK